MPKTGRSGRDVADRGFAPSNNRSSRGSRNRAGDNPDRSRTVLGAGPQSKTRDVTGQVRQDRLAIEAQRKARREGIAKAALSGFVRTGIMPTGESLGIAGFVIPGAGWGAAAVAAARAAGLEVRDEPPAEGRDNQNEVNGGSLARQPKTPTPKRTLTAPAAPAQSPRRVSRQLFRIHSRSLVG